MLLFAMLLSGCAGKKASQAPAAPRTGKPTAQAKAAVGGAVSWVDPVARFVALTCTPDRMPGIDQNLGVYRHGQRVAQVKVSGPRRDNNIVADIVTGAPEVGDEARAD
jgi:hypothetical protein